MTDVIQPRAATFGTQGDTRIEFVMLCDAAQTSQEGKLYVLGGGWTQIARLLAPPGTSLTPPPTQFAIAASFLIDWNDANRPINIRVTIEHQDERPPLYEAQAQLTAGRPPQMVPGDPLRAVIALPVLMMFTESGSYCIRTRMEGAPREEVVRFHVIDALMTPPPGGAPAP
jgi:hypothetical protein